MSRFGSKNVIVTGGGTGIGAAIAADLARQGANVCVSDIDEDAAQQVVVQIRLEGGTAIAAECDVTVREALRNTIEATVDAFGSLDVMFNNAGVSQVRPFMAITEDDWNSIIRINALSVLLGTQEAGRQMIAQGKGGKIINTGSVASRQAYPLFAHYGASKFAVVALTQAAARAFAKHRITVNCFAPGVVATNIWKGLDRDYEEAGLGDQRNELMTRFMEDVLLGRSADTSDIVGLTSFLASDESNYITGQTLMVDGGMVLL